MSLEIYTALLLTLCSQIKMQLVTIIASLFAAALPATARLWPWATHTAHASNSGPWQSSRPPLRRLQAGTEELPVRVADFAALPTDLSGIFLVPDIELTGRVQVPPGPGSAGAVVSGGVPGPVQARQLRQVLEDEMAEVPAADGQLADELQWPGANIRGSGIPGHAPHGAPAFPTVWAPFRSGWVFQTAGHGAPPGTILHFANVTLVLPNATYAGVYDSGFLDFLRFGENSRVCFTNSALVLASCQGYDAETYKMWCCSASRCNIVFTQQRLDELGVDPGDTLDHIPCYGLDEAGGV
eukprot:jgi/Ulvmu1/7811/UM004_0040.1